jgi:hypothetical protein
MDNLIDGIDGKLGHGFMSADKLEELILEIVISQGRHLSVLTWIQVLENS